MKKYYHLVSDTSEGYQETTKYDSIQDYPVVSEIDMLLDMVGKIEHKLLKNSLTHKVRSIYTRYANELNIHIEALINY